MNDLLSGLSAALALNLGMLFLMVGARMWQCREEYVDLLGLHWERFDTLILFAGMFGFTGFGFWQRSRASYAFVMEQWPPEIQAAFYIPIAIVSVWAMLWWVYRRVLGQEKGRSCWRWMVITTVIVGFVVAQLGAWLP